MGLKVKWTGIIVGVFILMSVVLTAAPKTLTSAQTSHPYPGYMAPTFTLSQVSNGQPVSLSAFQGKPMFINFFASWCPPCNAEAPDLVQAYHQYGNKVAFISVNLANQDTTLHVQQFLNKYGIQFPTLLDKTGDVASLYNVLAVPTSLFVNRQGLIVARYSGALPRVELMSELQRISN